MLVVPNTLGSASVAEMVSTSVLVAVLGLIETEQSVALKVGSALLRMMLINTCAVFVLGWPSPSTALTSNCRGRVS